MSAVTTSTNDILRESEREAERNDREAIRWALSDPRGRRFAAWIIREKCGFALAVDRGGPEKVMLNEGKRHIAIDLLADFERFAPDGLDAMEREALDRRKAKRKSKQAAEAAKGDEE